MNGAKIQIYHQVLNPGATWKASSGMNVWIYLITAYNNDQTAAVPGIIWGDATWKFNIYGTTVSVTSNINTGLTNHSSSAYLYFVAFYVNN